MSEHSEHSGSVEHVVPVTTYVGVFLALDSPYGAHHWSCLYRSGPVEHCCSTRNCRHQDAAGRTLLHAREICCRLNPDRYFGRLLLALSHDHFNAVRRADTRLGNRLAWLGRDDSAATPSILGDIYQAHGVGVRLQKKGAHPGPPLLYPQIRPRRDEADPPRDSQRARGCAASAVPTHRKLRGPASHCTIMS